MVKIGFAVSIGSGIEASPRLEFAEALEEMGYDSFWLPHFISREIHAFDCLDMLAAVAARTRTVKLGTIVLQVPLCHPVDLARRIVTLDHLTNGRFILGVGVGGHPTEFDHLGVPYQDRGVRTDEALEVMRRLWTEEEVTFQGKFYHIKDVVQKPKPIQTPHPRILVGGGYHGAAARFAPDSAVKGGFTKGWLRRAARWDGWLPGGPMSTGEREVTVLQEGMEKIKAASLEMGRTIRNEEFDLTVACFGQININENRQQALKEVQEWYDARVAKGYHQVQANPTLEGLQAAGGIGRPEEVAQLVNGWIGMGRELPALKRLVIMFASLRILEQLERFHKQVWPLLQRA